MAQSRSLRINTGSSASGIAYLLLAGLLASAAVPMWRHPHQAADFLFGKALLRPDAPYVPLLRVLATGLATAAVGSLALGGAAASGQLNQLTARRMTLGLAIMSLLELLVLVAHFCASTLTVRGFVAGSVLAALMAVLAGGSCLRWQQSVGHLRGFWADVRQMVGGRTGLGRWYGLVALLLIADHVQCLLMPTFTLKDFIGAGAGRRDAVFVLQALGAAFLALPPWALVLKDEAESGQLRTASRHNRMLLGAFLVASVGHMMALVPWWLTGRAGWGLPGLLIIWAVTLGSVLAGLAAQGGGVVATKGVHAPASSRASTVTTSRREE
ncbi:hypothetical protein WJX72_002927 [[Myrmecia] bisecta]|uniref:Ferric oxidoreductase domain-containing protein n=1 Tax=[Myrmecia] bisecta TaxID=41462 RepID=A0AAW1PPQ0_9CHLO